jgi:TetR/AcrR family tetracycline transcriptional repressor
VGRRVGPLSGKTILAAVAHFAAGTYLTDARLDDTMEAALALTTESGYRTEDAAALLNTLYCFTIGFAIEEQAVQPSRETDERYAPARRKQRVDPDVHPRTADAGPALFEGFEERFERGLAIVLDGAEIR